MATRTWTLRTLLLSGVLAAASSLAPGCVVDTTSDNGSCLDNQQFQVFWEEDDGNPAGAVQYSCAELAGEHDYVNLHTNIGSFTTDQPPCESPFNYMGRLFTFTGVTQSGIPAGTYVISADLVDQTQTVISSAAGPGAGYPITSCNGQTVAFQFIAPPP